MKIKNEQNFCYCIWKWQAWQGRARGAWLGAVELPSPCMRLHSQCSACPFASFLLVCPCNLYPSSCPLFLLFFFCASLFFVFVLGMAIEWWNFVKCSLSARLRREMRQSRLNDSKTQQQEQQQHQPDSSNNKWNNNRHNNMPSSCSSTSTIYISTICIEMRSVTPNRALGTLELRIPPSWQVDVTPVFMIATHKRPKFNLKSTYAKVILKNALPRLLTLRASSKVYRARI